MNIAADLLSAIKCHIPESFVMEILARSYVQEKFTKSLIGRALGRNVSEDEYICLDEGKWIKMENVFKYPFFKRAIEKVTVSCHASIHFNRRRSVPIARLESNDGGV